MKVRFHARLIVDAVIEEEVDDDIAPKLDKEHIRQVELEDMKDIVDLMYFEEDRVQNCKIEREIIDIEFVED